jgi:hypothetical protein
MAAELIDRLAILVPVRRVIGSLPRAINCGHKNMFLLVVAGGGNGDAMEREIGKMYEYLMFNNRM